MPVAALAQYPDKDVNPDPDRHRYYRADADQFTLLGVQAGDYVIAGDSLIERGRWSELLEGPTAVRNRGIDGDTITALGRRLEALSNGKPAVIVLHIGSNDLMRGRGVRASLINYDKLVRDLIQRSPQSRIIITGLMPKAAKAAATVRRFNSGLTAIADRYSLQYVDLFQPFANIRGGMHTDLTYDRLHLNGAGYRLFAKILAPFLPHTKPVL